MNQKTRIEAEDGKQEIVITREFDLPLELLFKAYEDPDIIEQWMGTKVLKHEGKTNGSWQFETADASGQAVFRAHGVYHAFVPNQRITRTFEMENTQFEAQLEFLQFERLPDEKSMLTMHIIYRSVECRDKMLQMGMSQGMNMAHNRLQQVVARLK